MVIDSGLIQRPAIKCEVDAGSPVFQPDIIAAFDQVVDDACLDGCAEEIGANTGAMDNQHRTLAGFNRSLHMDEIALETVLRLEGDDVFAPGLCSWRFELGGSRHACSRNKDSRA